MKLVFTLILFHFTFNIFGQTISYQYDAAGNRVKREGSASCDFAVTVSAASNNLTPTMGQQITITPVCSGGGCDGVVYTWTGINVSGTGESKELYAPATTGSFTYTIVASQPGCTAKTVTFTLNVQAGGSHVLANGCYTLNVYGKRLQSETNAVGARIKLYTPNSNNNQIIQLTSEDAGSYRITSLAANKVWEPSSPITDGAGTYLRSSTGSTAQKWYISPTSTTNSYSLTSRANPSLVMELAGGVNTEGNSTVLWPLWGGTNQYYQFDPVSCPVIPPNCDFAVSVPSASNNLSPTMGQKITITPVCLGGGCDGVVYTWTGINVSGTGESKELYAPATTGSFTYTIVASQPGCTAKTVTFTLNVQAGGSHVLANGCYTLNVYGKRLQSETNAVGARIKLYTPNSNNNQIIQLTGEDAGSYRITSLAANKVWEPSSPITDGAGTYLRSFTGSTAQKWYISPTSTTNSYSLTSRANPSLVMELAGGVNTEGNSTVLWPLWGGTNQYYQFDPVSCPVIPPNCDFAVSVPSASNNLSPTMGQKITITPVCLGGGCDGVVYTWTGINVSGTGESKELYAPATTGSFTYTIVASQPGCTAKTVTFTLNVQAGGSHVLANGCYTLNVYGKRLQSETNAVGARIKLYTPNSNNNQIIQLTGEDAGSYRITSLAANKVWEPSSPITDWSGTYLQSSTGSTAQKWYISPTSTANSYSLTSRANPSLVMELAGGVDTEGNSTVLWPLWGGSNQYYRFDLVSCPTARMASNSMEYINEAFEPEVTVFPNPVSNYLKFKGTLNIENITIFNVKGNLVLESTKISEAGLDVSGLPTGIYLIEIKTSNGRNTKVKILKE